ncbi:MAG: hypothetical protein RLZZ444_4608 [Pseudomonadota bacterium]
MSGIYNGQCFCGEVRFRMHGKPMFIHCCHCTDCQRQTGSAFALNGMIETECLEITAGEPVATRMRTDSGYPHDIYRCDTCQTALWSDYGGRQWLRFVRITTLADGGDLVPDVHIYTRSKLPWVGLPASAQTFDGYYDAKTVWPPEAMARLKAARAKAG